MALSPPLLIAHRGESVDAPENTLAAINLAWQRGAAAVEIDVQLTADHKIVVIHDTDTLRVAGIKKVIKKSRLHDLANLDVAHFFKPTFAPQHLPTLQQVLDTVPPHGKLVIELKSNASIVPYLTHLLNKSHLQPHQIEIIAFDANTLALAKTQMPQYKMLWLLDLDYYWPWWLLRINPNKLVLKAKLMGFDGVNVWAGRVITSSFVDHFHQSNLLVYTWTVNNPMQAQALQNMGVDGITTDKAHWMANQLLP